MIKVTINSLGVKVEKVLSKRKYPESLVCFTVEDDYELIWVRTKTIKSTTGTINEATYYSNLHGCNIGDEIEFSNGPDATKCDDCGVLFREVSEIPGHHGQIYMVTAKLWEELGLDKERLHLTCLEKRLNRKLIKEDFTDVNTWMNEKYDGSKRTRERINKSTVLSDFIRKL